MAITMVMMMVTMVTMMVAMVTVLVVTMVVTMVMMVVGLLLLNSRWALGVLEDYLYFRNLVQSNWFRWF